MCLRSITETIKREVLKFVDFYVRNCKIFLGVTKVYGGSAFACLSLWIFHYFIIPSRFVDSSRTVWPALTIREGALNSRDFSRMNWLLRKFCGVLQKAFESDRQLKVAYSGRV
jgi:hypothetical protein